MASDNIKQSYVDYITTSFDIADKEYAKELRIQLEEEGFVTKGPYLDVSGSYKTGESLSQLIASGIASREFAELESVAEQKRELKLERSLYLHQVEALKKAAAGNNLVVTTGTGSGKTECFLLPILHSLLKEKEVGTLSANGVRAIIIYPMNALANDQIKRMRRLLRNYPDITFGLYNGNTEHARAKAREPYVRDFDPTLNINFLKPDFLPTIQYPKSEENIFSQIESLTSEAEIQKWTKQSTSFFESLSDKLVLRDLKGTEWVNLNLYDSLKNKEFESTTVGFSKCSQEIWLTAHSYFVEPKVFEILKKQFIPDGYDIDFPQRSNIYGLYNREYSWSPGYKSIFQTSYTEVEIKIGGKKHIKETVELPTFVCTEDGDFVVKTTKKQIEKLVPHNVVRVNVVPTYSHLLWEEEYDASQKETTSFDVPCKEIIEYLHLKQREYDGYYFNLDNELVCFDASLSGMCNGFLIRKDFLQPPVLVQICLFLCFL